MDGAIWQRKASSPRIRPSDFVHVIRGFIKGMSVDDLLGKGDFDELPQDERTISRQVYEAVYDRVWTAWYEPLCRSGEVWDSQDLVRSLLDEDRLPVSHVAVFCDEAQDFYTTGFGSNLPVFPFF